MFTSGSNVTEKELQNIKIIKPKRSGGLWKGREHSEVIDVFRSVLKDVLKKYRITTKPLKFALSDNLQDLLISAELTMPPSLNWPKSLQCNPCIGLLYPNSTHKRINLYMGAVSTAWEAGSVVVSKKESQFKKTKEFDLEEHFLRPQLKHTIQQELIVPPVVLRDDLTVFEKQYIKPYLYPKLLIEAARANYKLKNWKNDDTPISWSRLEEVDHMMDRHGFPTNPISYLDLAFFFSTAMRHNNPIKQPEHLLKIHHLLSKFRYQ